MARSAQSETVSLLNSLINLTGFFYYYYSLCLVARGINKERQTHLVKSQMLMDSFVLSLSFALSPLFMYISDCSARPLKGELHYVFIPARFPPQPWLSCWSCRKQGTSPPQRLSRSVSHTLSTSEPPVTHTHRLSLGGLFAFCLSPVCAGCHPALRCSRRCGGHRPRRPRRSSRRRTWV